MKRVERSASRTTRAASPKKPKNIFWIRVWPTVPISARKRNSLFLTAPNSGKNKIALATN